MLKSNREAEVPRGDSPIVRRVHPLRPWLLGIVYLIVLVPLTLAPRHSGNVWSRYMTIEGVVERGTLAVDGSPLLAGSGSPDLVKFGRHLYSDKPPVLPAIGALVYEGIYLVGVRISASPSQFVVTNLILVSSIVGVASALTLVWLRQLLQVVPIRPWISDVLTLGLGFGSLLLSYGVTFNNHSVAAALVTGALAMTLLEEPGTKVRLRRVLAGAFCGLAATIDLPAGGALMAALAIWQALRIRNIPWAFVLGTIPPLAFHCLLQSLVTGTPLPAEMYPEAFNYPGSYWATNVGTWKETVPRWQFGLELLLGQQGWLTITPTLFLAPVGLILALRKPGDPLRPAACVVGGVVVVLLLYYIWGVRRTDYAGQSFGTRHLLAVTPICYLFSVVALARLRSRLASIAFAIFTAVGLVYAVSGCRDPWSRVEVHAQRDPLVWTLQCVVLYPWSSYQR